MVTLTFSDGSTLVVDASLRQSHSQENEVTDYPTETGANITDNIRARPRTYSLEGVISATPIVNPGEKPEHNRHMAAYHRLQTAADARATIGVTTGLKTYKTLAIESLHVPRDPETGVDLYFTLDLKEITYASTATATVPASALGDTASQRTAQALRHRGVVQASAATSAQAAAAAKAKANAANKPQQRASALYQVIQFLKTGVLGG